MKTNTKSPTRNIKKIFSSVVLGLFTINLIPLELLQTAKADSKIVYPLKKVSKLSCRFNKFNALWSDCIQDLPILKTSDYSKYATLNWGYNDFTRTYTVLWWASYKYWWDVWYGWHMWVDIATAEWTPVYSMADWEVVQAWTRNAEWNFISIKHNINWKIVISNYMHLSFLNVSKWDIVKAWDFIWEVWTTWNSTWNHLHFQIDTETKFSPIYYDRATCPYSYYEITEKWVCFNELEKITVDPLLFLETNWWILNSVTTTEKVDRIQSSNSSNVTKTSSSSRNYENNNVSIFNKNINVWANPWDIREVQSIYKALSYYNWEINWDYNDILESVIKYQLDKNIIYSRNDDWAGNFWPKTRAQTKIDYEKYLAAGWKKVTTFISSNNKNKNNNINDNITNDLTVKEDNRVISSHNTEKISREKLMTREELEAKEVKEFLEWYKINLDFRDWNQVWVWETKSLDLSVVNQRWKYFRWSMPWEMTFEIENKAVSVFPEKLFYFTDGKREIKLTWLKDWHTKIKVNVWKVTIKTIDLIVWKWGISKVKYENKKSEIPKKEDYEFVVESKEPTSAQIISRTANLWETKNAIAVLKSWSKSFINQKYSWKYKLKSSNWNLVCMKSWEYQNLENIHNSSCESWFRKEIEFDYKDTVNWIILFDYKANNKDLKFEIINPNWEKISEKNVAVTENNNFAKNYKYKDEVQKAIENWIASIENKWFLENKSISEVESYSWIKNTLKNVATNNDSLKWKINERITEVEAFEKWASIWKNMSRWEILELVKKYLIFEENNVVTLYYKDLNEEQNQIANAIFNRNESWKETYGKELFKPDEKITRWETVYLIMKTLKNWNPNNLTLK